jgi:ribosome-binding ATPase YchF (GTP1/OBG family)
MKVGVIGYPQVGKSALYRAAAQGQAKGEVTAVPVPDPRFDRIVAQVKPKKETPATVILHDDIESIAGSGKMFSLKFLEQARKADVLLHVVRAFESPMAPYHASVDPVRDQEAVDVEMVLSDLQTIETRLEKLQKMQATRAPGSPEYNEKMLFDRIKPMLEEGTPIRAMELSEEEQRICRNYQFLSAKETVVAFNVGESGSTPAIDAQIEKLKAIGTQAFTVCATIEEEIAQLDPADQPEFLPLWD